MKSKIKITPFYFILFHFYRDMKMMSMLSDTLGGRMCSCRKCVFKPWEHMLSYSVSGWLLSSCPISVPSLVQDTDCFVMLIVPGVSWGKLAWQLLKAAQATDSWRDTHRWARINTHMHTDTYSLRVCVTDPQGCCWVQFYCLYRSWLGLCKGINVWIKEESEVLAAAPENPLSCLTPLTLSTWSPVCSREEREESHVNLLAAHVCLFPHPWQPAPHPQISHTLYPYTL